MYVAGDRVHYTPSDLAAYAGCAYAGLQRLQVLLNPEPGESVALDPLHQRIRELGSDHEQRVLRMYRQRYGAGVQRGERPRSRADYPAATARTLAALDRTQSPQCHVVYQAPLAHGRLYGVADFLVRYGNRWQLVEAKLAHRIKAAARVQIGAYAQALIGLGVPMEPDALVHLGNGTSDVVSIVDVLGETTQLREEFENALDAVQRGNSVRWGEDDVRICGWCDDCRRAAHLRRDIRTVAGLKIHERPAFVAAGIRTIDQLANGAGPVGELDDARVEDLRAQARLQVIALPVGAELDPALAGPIAFEVRDRTPIEQLPEPSEGDLFFDFESDPMWRADGDDSLDGLEYLFGVWAPGRSGDEYVAFWAHDRDQERRALAAFLAFVDDALLADPNLHIYHYSAYETTVLQRAARRHQLGVQRVQQLIAGGVFIDLLPVVRGSLRTSQDGFGLKKIEPLYMGDSSRGGDVVDAAASVVGYQRYAELLADGKTVAAQELLTALEDYNRYDCLSTYRLRQWLRSVMSH